MGDKDYRKTQSYQRLLKIVMESKNIDKKEADKFIFKLIKVINSDPSP